VPAHKSIERRLKLGFLDVIDETNHSLGTRDASVASDREQPLLLRCEQIPWDVLRLARYGLPFDPANWLPL